MKNYLLPLVLLLPLSVQADDCKFSKEIDQVLDLSGSEELAVLAAAGDLEIRGLSGTNEARIMGNICASKEQWIADSSVITSSGKRAEIVVDLNGEENSWQLLGRSYLYLDLNIEVPEHIALDIKDSSGDIDISGVGAVTVRDSSGDIEIEDSMGPIVMFDSSGDIDLEDIKKDVTVESDSSGDIRGRDIEGAVLVVSDSSGDITFRDVGTSFIVERDSSGDISATRIGGDFRVNRDSSGDIDYRDVSGKVEIPENKS